jgi:hypothetical protein
MKLQRLVSIATPVVLAASCAAAQDEACPKDSRPDCSRAIVFFHRIQAELRDNNRAALADEIEYPLLTSILHKKTHIQTRKQFLALFDQVFDKGVRCAILNASDKDVWGNWQGYTVGNGAIWFDDRIPRGEVIDTKAPDFWTKYPFQIVTVNNDSALPCKSSRATQ